MITEVSSDFACQYAMGAVAFQGMIFEVVKVLVVCWFAYKIFKLGIDYISKKNKLKLNGKRS